MSDAPNQPRAEWAITKTFRIREYVAELTAGPAGFVCEWSPDRPPRGSFSQDDLNAYFKVRHELLSEVVQRMGGSILVVDI